MFRYVLLSAFLSLFLISFNAYSESGWIHSVKVDKIVVVNSGGINVKLSPSLTSCVSQSGYGASFASIYPDHPGRDQILSLLLTAQVSGQTISVWLSNETCRVGEVVLGGL